MEQTLAQILQRLDEIGAAIAKLPKRAGRPATKTSDPDKREKQRLYMREYMAKKRQTAKLGANGAEVAHQSV